VTALPPLRLLSVFEAVARCRGVKAAAEDFNVSPAAVSQAVRQLEDSIGVELFDRRTRPLALTEAGKQLHDSCSTGLRIIRDCIGEIQNTSERASRSVSIACSVGTATHWLMPRLPSFYRTHADIVINVMTTASGEAAFVAGIDIAIRYGSGAWRDGISHLLFEEEITPVCSPAFLQRFSGSKERLVLAPLIHVDDRSWIGWREFLQQTQQSELRRNPSLHFTNYVQATQAALADQGIMLGWRAITGDLVRAGQLVRAPSMSLRQNEAHYAVTPYRSAKMASIETVARWLVEAGRDNRVRLRPDAPAQTAETA
jgi:LysR family transcriptional regulator, glycine cleavage system transcriptional activator